MDLLFTYGTLRDPQVQDRVIGRQVRGTPDALIGYEKSTITLKGITYPILLEAGGGKIEGETLALSADEFKATDKYETDAYRRTRVKLKSGVDAWVYVK